MATTSDTETTRAIEGALLDYFEGWFDADPARMERALHPELAKRSIRDDALPACTTPQMIEWTAAGEGKKLDLPDRGIEIEITDVSDTMATAVVRSAVYLEYVHLGRTADGWKIVNTLWEWVGGRPPL